MGICVRRRTRLVVRQEFAGRFTWFFGGYDLRVAPPTHVALLRGINVGGVKVPMAVLREVASGCGHADVATYIQSGNLLFTPADASAEASSLSTELRSALASAIGVDVPFIVRDRDAFAAEIDANPFGEPEDPRLLHVVLRDTDLADAEHATIATAREKVTAAGSRDEIAVVGRTAYLWTPDGFGRSVLADALNRGGRGGSPARNATARNWKTMLHLRGLLEGSA